MEELSVLLSNCNLALRIDDDIVEEFKRGVRHRVEAVEVDAEEGEVVEVRDRNERDHVEDETIVEVEDTAVLSQMVVVQFLRGETLEDVLASESDTVETLDRLLIPTSAHQRV